MSNPFADPKDSVTVHISSLSLLKILVVLLVLAFLYIVWDVVILLFVSLIFAASLGPAVNWLEAKKIPRSGAILLIYSAVLLFLAGVIALLIPPITEQIGQLAANFPFYYERLQRFFGGANVPATVAQGLQQNLQSFGDTISSYTSSVFTAVSGLFGGVLTLILVLVLTYYFSVRKDGIKNLLQSVTPLKYQKYAMNLLMRIQDKLGLWLRGQLLLSGIIFLVTLIGLLILDVHYALVLALIAGITEAIPMIGPIIGAIPAIALAFIQSPLKAGLVIIMYIVVQQLESNLIVPKVMQRAVGLNPVVVIVAILLGGKLAGVLGAVLAIPVATAAMVVARDWFGVAMEEIREKEKQLFS